VIRGVRVSTVRVSRRRTIAAVAMPLVFLSCGKTPDRPGAASDTTSIASALLGGPVRDDSSRHAADTVLLAEAQGSRAYQSSSGDSSAVVWLVRERTGWRSIWRSRDLLGAEADAKLEDLNADGTPDLFWSIYYEGIRGAMVVLRGNDGITELFPDVEHCLRPELQAVDHRQLIVAYLSGAYSQDDCDNPLAQVCLRQFQIVWPQFYQVEGKALIEARREPAFYRDLSERYRRNADELQGLIDGERNIDEARRVYSRCPAEAPQRMRTLADSALTLVRKFGV
jgi:hypothetical protein